MRKNRDALGYQDRFQPVNGIGHRVFTSQLNNAKALGHKNSVLSDLRNFPCTPNSDEIIYQPQKIANRFRSTTAHQGSKARNMVLWKV
jgi:hypothetical protein